MCCRSYQGEGLKFLRRCLGATRPKLMLPTRRSKRCGPRPTKPTLRSKCSARPWPTSPRNLQLGSIVISWRHVAQSEIDRRISVPRLCLGCCRRWKTFPFLNSFRPAPSSATNRQGELLLVTVHIAAVIDYDRNDELV